MVLKYIYTEKYTLTFRFPWAGKDRAQQWVANISTQTVDGKP